MRLGEVCVRLTKARKSSWFFMLISWKFWTFWIPSEMHIFRDTSILLSYFSGSKLSRSFFQLNKLLANPEQWVQELLPKNTNFHYNSSSLTALAINMTTSFPSPVILDRYNCRRLSDWLYWSVKSEARTLVAPFCSVASLGLSHKDTDNVIHLTDETTGLFLF